MSYEYRKHNVNFQNGYGDYLTSWLYSKFPEQIINTLDIAFENNYIRLGNTAYEKRGIDVIKQRETTVRIFNISDYDLGYDLLINYIVAFFRDDGPYYLIDLVTEKRYRVNLDEVKVKEKQGSEKRFSEIELGFSIIDSLPEKLNPNIESGSLVSTGSFDITLPEYAAETPFQLTLTNSTGANTDFYIELTNRNKKGNIRISEINYVSGTNIVIDTLNGTCTLNPDQLNIKKSITDGTFFLLYKGVNSIYYKSLQGVPVTYSISYRQRSAV